MIRRISPFAAIALVASVSVLLMPATASAAAPMARWTNATLTDFSSVRLDGFVNPEGETTTYRVVYDLGSSTWCLSNGASGSPSDTTAPTDLGFTDDTEHAVSIDLTGLAAHTQYCAMLIATNGDGEGDSWMTVWLQSWPETTTSGAAATGPTTARVDGQVNPEHENPTYQVLYGPADSVWCQNASGAPPFKTDPVDLGFGDDTFHDVSVDLTGLTPGTEYCAALAASSGSLGTSANQVTWTQDMPDALTYDAYSTGATTVTVEGTVAPVGPATTYQVQYDVASSDWCTSGGTSGSPANSTSATSDGLDPTNPEAQFVAAGLTGLTEGMEYCAQLIATNGSKEADGGQVPWTQGAPFADTFGIDPTGYTTARFDGDVNPAGKTTTYAVEYDVAGSTWCESGGAFGTPANATSPAPLTVTDGTFHEILVDLSGLTEGTTYCADIVATNSDGTAEGFQELWTQPTQPPPPPPPVKLTVQMLGGGTVTSSPAGLNCSSTCSATFDPGTRVTLTATGGTFLRWGGFACIPPPGTTPGPTCTFTLNADTTVSAFFSTPAGPPTHALNVQFDGDGSGTVTSRPAGIDCGSTCSSSFASNSQVTLTATPAPGSSFDSWGGGCSGIDVCVVTMTADQAVTAIFSKIAPAPKPICKVPKLKGKTLAAAKTAIRHAHCAVGRITKAYSAKVKKGRVVSQKPRPGTRHAAGTKVRLTVSKGRKPA